MLNLLTCQIYSPIQQVFATAMASFAVPNRLPHQLGYPSSPVVTQHLSSTQATSTFATNSTDRQSAISHSPAINSLRKVSIQVRQPECPADKSSKMARDNGQRGSYRHVGGSQAKVQYMSASFWSSSRQDRVYFQDSNLLTDCP